MVVEYHHNKPSGILTSKPRWLFDLGDEEMWFESRAAQAVMLSVCRFRSTDP